MARYRCYYLGANGKILVADDIEALSDTDALAQARRRFAELSMFPRFELWLADRRIHQEARSREAV